MSGYKVWHCSYRVIGSYGYYHDIDVIVVAEIEGKALGMACTAYPETRPNCWSASEIPTDRESVTSISECES
jgi:hypothetical protein